MQAITSRVSLCLPQQHGSILKQSFACERAISEPAMHHCRRDPERRPLNVTNYLDLAGRQTQQLTHSDKALVAYDSRKRHAAASH